MRSIAQIKRRLEQLTLKQGKIRDELRDLYEQADAMHDAAKDAHESLEYAIDKLSELA
jgi:uncharacterized coiled-coil DUF342 family protein